MFSPIQFRNNELILLDQRRLPNQEVFVSCRTLEDAHEAIKVMVVRGAPCIGFTAIYAMVLWLQQNSKSELQDFRKAGDFLKTARPTAVNLQFEVDHILALAQSEWGPGFVEKVVQLGARRIEKSEVDNRAMAAIAEQDLDQRLKLEKYQILTHCNTGFLACGSVGTALGVVQNLHEKHKLENCWVDETRPYLQGSRLTAYELTKLNAPHKIVVEGAASYLMKTGRVDAIFTGADRIVANGDTANKVGTSNLAILAKHYDIPFYIVAPSSSFDLKTETGESVEIELRPEEEILNYKDHRIAPMTSAAFNPSFDITDGELITGIISEKGIALGDYKSTLRGIV